MRTLPLSALNASANLLLSGSALTPVIRLRLRITLIIEFQTGKRRSVLGNLHGGRKPRYPFDMVRGRDQEEGNDLIGRGLFEFKQLFSAP